MSQEATTRPTLAVDAQEGALAALERVLSSAQFHGATRLQQMLRRVVLQTLSGDWESLKEARLGVEVFGRGEAFDPSADSIVRTHATMLRKRLAEYYAGPGRQDQVRIEIPRGGYVATFSSEPPCPAPIAATPNSRPSYPGWMLVAVGLAAGAAGAFLTAGFGEARHGNPSGLPVWSSLLRDGSTTTLALGTPYFLNLGEGLYVRDVRVNDGSEHAQFPELGVLAKGPKPAATIYTGIGEALGLERIARMYERNGWPLHVVRSDQLRWQDLKDENVIFLGSFRFRSLEGEMDAHSHFEFDASSSGGKLRNLRPLPGEQAVYASDYVNGRGTTYAVVTLLPGKTPGRRILLLHGMHTWGTQAAAEFVTNEDHLRTLTAAFRQRAGQQEVPEFLQALLRVELRNGHPMTIHVVSVRDLTQGAAR